MSGICGWYARQEQPCGIEDMAAVLSRFDQSPRLSANLKHSALAAAALADGAKLWHWDGVAIAVWGDCGLPLPEIGRAWRERGAGLCAALSGAFALAILDERQDAALLAVDKCCSRPLIYAQSGATLVFGSTATALIRHPALAGRIDPQALYHYLHFHVIPTPLSIYAGQHRLKPGEYLYYRGGRAELGSYWRLEFDEARQDEFPDLRARFLGGLQAAVRKLATGPAVGAFLSGGTDSSTVSAFLGRAGGGAARTYSIGFDAPGYDEMAYARIASKHFGTRHHEYYVTPQDVVDALPALAAICDQPFGNASAVPAYYCARLAREDGIRLLLAGDGGDELFGGNERYARQAVFSRYEMLPSMLRQLAIEPLLFRVAANSKLALLRKARSYVEQAVVPLPARLDTYNLLQLYGSDSVLTRDFLAACDTGGPLASLREAYWRTNARSQINQLCALDMKFTLADNDLPKVNKACELAGVDVAFPFLDDDVIAFAAALAPDRKLRGTQLRHFFKQALRETLPAAIIKKQKHGFGLPFGLWLQKHQGLRSMAYDHLSDLKRREIVRADFIDALLARHLKVHPGYHGTMVWVLLMLEQWFVQHAPAPVTLVQAKAAVADA